MKNYSTINNNFRVVHGITPNEYMVALCVMDEIDEKHFCHELNITQHQVHQAIKKLLRKNLVAYSEAGTLKITALFYEGHGSN